jgi:metal-responsive CopG/Arc/MetJ family transcriptional regulator
MKTTVQMTLDGDLLARVDRVVRRLKTSRSAFTREALQRALARQATLDQEARHKRGYAARPVRKGEFDRWTGEQVWPE